MKKQHIVRPLASVISAGALLAGLAFATGSAFGQTQDIQVTESAITRSLEFAADEIEVFSRGEDRTGRLKQILEAGVPGSTVTTDFRSRVLLKINGGYDPQRAAAGTDAIRSVLPGAEVAPVFYIKDAPRNEWSRRLATREVIGYLGLGQTGDELRQKSGALGVIATRVAGVVRLQYGTPFHALDAVKNLSALGYSVKPLLRQQMARKAAALPEDQFFPAQWHLANTGQNGGTPGVDVNVLNAWSITKGIGTTVAVIDDGLELIHPDLRGNCPPASSLLHFDFNDDDSDPSPVRSAGDAHGTACGGLVGATQNNGQLDPVTGKRLGVTGVAPLSRLFGIRLISGPFSDLDSASAITWAPGNEIVHVTSNSWGVPDRIYGLIGPDILTKAAFRDAALKGREGRGTVTLFAAGNGRFERTIGGQTFLQGDDSNQDGYSNSRYVVAVGAVGSTGRYSSYSEQGANILVSAPGGGVASFGAEQRITTVDVSGVGGYNPGPGDLPNTDYTNTFNGTSAATPVAAGAVALMISTNPELGWRDVKEILASTARRIDETNPDWVKRPALPSGDPDRTFNEAGFKFHHTYGSGLVDTFAAVARSFTWKNLQPEVVQSVPRTELVGGVAISTVGTPLVRTYDFSGANFPNLRVEQIEIEVKISTASRSDYQITVTSPSGVRSILTRPHVVLFPIFNPNRDFKDTIFDNETDRVSIRDGGWVFTTTHNWGENSRGVWTVEIADQVNNGIGGRLEASAIRLYGTPAGPQRVVLAEQQMTVNEPIGAAINQPIIVRRLGATGGAFSVGYQTTISSATAGQDYTVISGTLDFADGQSTAQIDLPILPDSDPEDIEVVNVVLVNLAGANVAFGGTTLTAVKIVDAQSNAVNIFANDPIAGETSIEVPADTGTFQITRGTITSTPLNVLYRLTGTAVEGSTAGSDYNPLPASGALRVATIPAFESSVNVTIEPRDDTQIEGTESVIATLELNGTSYVLGIANSAEMQIVDNDRSSVQIVATDDLAVESPTIPAPNQASFRITRTPVTELPLAIFLDYGGTQILGTNYLLSYVDAKGDTVVLSDPLVSQTVEIPGGVASLDVTLSPLDDNIYQATKTVVIGLRPDASYDFSFGFLTVARINIVETDPFPDTIVPQVKLVSPKNNARFDIAEAVTFAGSASDDAKSGLTASVDKVLYRLNRGPWKLITPFTPGADVSWSFDIDPGDMVAGFNTLEVQAFDPDGNPSKVSFANFKRVQIRNLNATASGAGSISGAKPSYEVGDTVTLNSSPATGNIFGGWSGDVADSSRKLVFTMPDQDVAVVATFAPNPFTPETTGNFAGLIQGAQFNFETSGYLSLKISSSGAVTGKLTLGDVNASISGEFLSDGTLSTAIDRKNTTPLTMNLTVDLNPSGTQRITGTVTSSTFTAAVIADRAAYSKTAPAPTPLVKDYTVVLPPANPIGDADKDPRGFGVGHLSVSSTGAIKLSGVLPDGSKMAASHALSKNNTWPLFLSLYGKKGVLLGDMTFDAGQASSDVNGTFDWFKTVATKDKVFPLGFKIENGAFIGSEYTAPPSGRRGLDGFANTGDNGTVFLEEGGLLAGITKVVTFDTSNKVTVTTPGDDKLKVSVNAKSGAVSGSFKHPVSGKNVKITGVLFQKQEAAYGFFPGSSVPDVTPQSGRMTLSHP